MNRRFTAWKKSRTYGDIYGGRERRKLSDNIFARAHNLQCPEGNSTLPVLIEDNPSRDFFFPLTATEANKALKELPADDYQEITHIWLRRFTKKEKHNLTLPLAEFVCGGGVRAIILYPWRRDLIQAFGPNKPSRKTRAEYQRFCSSPLSNANGTWYIQWQLPQLRKFYLHLIYHEVGHHVDWYIRHWSKANAKQQEEAAEQYAYQKTSTAEFLYT